MVMCRVRWDVRGRGSNVQYGCLFWCRWGDPCCYGFLFQLFFMFFMSFILISLLNKVFILGSIVICI
eukprot:COSAG01_NODE_5393_length_4290_cov_113.585063_4_plen_67_part_00